MEYALYKSGVFAEIRQYPARPEDIEHKAVTWFPVVREYGDPFVGIENGAHVIRTVDPETLPPPVPSTISDRQFAHALKNFGVLTHSEAMEFVQTGTIPAPLQAVIDAIEDTEQREAAELMLAGATTFDRSHPMTELLRAAMKWTPEQADDLWRHGASL